MNCEMCNNPIVNEEDGETYSFYFLPRTICSTCIRNIDDALSVRREKKLSGKNYIGSLLMNYSYPPDMNVALKRLSGAKVTAEDMKAAKDYVKMENRRAKEHDDNVRREYQEEMAAKAKGTGFLVMGIAFLIAAVVLFAISIKPLDKHTAELIGTEAIINIQGTVFAAASFICCVVCFACSALVKYLKH